MAFEIHLVPVGRIDPAVMAWLALALGDSLKLSCVVRDTAIDPSDAYHPARQQYHSTHILSKLTRLDGDDETKILGVAEVDLFIPILTFVFGEAQVGHRAAVVSVYRLRQSFYGLPEDEALFYERCEKEAIHELGHAFGLVHCLRFECVMHFSNSIEQIDLKSNAFCADCAKFLASVGS